MVAGRFLWPLSRRLRAAVPIGKYGEKNEEEP
jgi:hypothetical protein